MTMVSQVIVYSLGVSLALSLVGFCEEKFSAMLGRSQRFLWVATMVLSILWPPGAMLWARPAAVPAPVAAQVVIPDAPAAPIAVAVSRGAEPRLAVTAPARTQTQKTWHPRFPSDRTLLWAWAVVSGVLLFTLAGADLFLHYRASRWQRATVLDRQVLVSEMTGPALLGTWRPKIVVPRWFLAEPAATQSLILEHEQQHIGARDPLLLRLALLIVAAVPWNLPLWWQLRRLRQAIELDCDARVLRAGAEAGSYGEVLLAVTQRAGSVPAGAIAMGEPVSALERRIRHLTTGPVRYSAPRALAAVIFWGVGVGVAFALQAPALPRSPAKIAVRAGAPVLVPQPAQASTPPAIEAPTAGRRAAARFPILAAAETPPPPRVNSAQRAARDEGARVLPKLLPPTAISLAPGNYDDSRSSEERIVAAVLAARPDLLSAGGPLPKLVTVFMTGDGKVDRSYVSNDPWQYLGTTADHGMGPDGKVADIGIVPELLAKLWEPLGLRPEQLGQIGHTYVGDGQPSSVHAAFVLYAWPRRPGESLGGVRPDDGHAFRSSFTYADAVAVIERHLPGVFGDQGGTPAGIPWLLFSPQGEVVDSGYWQGEKRWAPGMVIRWANPGKWIDDALGIPVVKRVGESPTVQVAFGWLGQEQPAK